MLTCTPQAIQIIFPTEHLQPYQTEPGSNLRKSEDRLKLRYQVASPCARILNATISNSPDAEPSKFLGSVQLPLLRNYMTTRISPTDVGCRQPQALTSNGVTSPCSTGICRLGLNPICTVLLRIYWTTCIGGDATHPHHADGFNLQYPYRRKYIKP